MKAPFIKYVCAYPGFISWFIGALILYTFMLAVFAANLSDLKSMLDSSVLIQLTIAFVSLTFLGWFVGMLLWRPIRLFCVKVNGSSYQINETVYVLSGPQKDKLCTVYELTRGQGGDPLLKLDLGEAARASYTDLFEEYSVTRHNTAEQGAAANP